MKAEPNIEIIIDAIRKSFGADTTELPETYEARLADSHGHCHVAALTLHEMAGGYILRGTVNGQTIHYWNLIGGVWIDTTVDQFPSIETIHGVTDATEEVLNKTTEEKSFSFTHKFLSNLDLENWKYNGIFS